MTNTIEYTYTSYKMPASEDITSGGADLAQAIAARIFPDAPQKGGNLWKIVYDEKIYICGFVAEGNTSALPTEEYFVTLEVKDGTVHHVNCYKCNFGDVKGAYFISSYGGIVIKNELNGDKYVFGAQTNTMFLIPAHSFFLEGDHEAFNDLPAGTYDATLLA